MKTIIVHGELGKRFGGRWVLDVASPHEAVRAIEANTEGLAGFLFESLQQGVAYQVVAGGVMLSETEFEYPVGRESLEIVPVFSGGNNTTKGIALIIIGAAIIYFSGGTASGPGTSMMAAGLAQFGIGLVIAGAALLLAPTPKAVPQPEAAPDMKNSYYFNGPVNNTRQGGPVPVGYGELLVGSQVISAGVTTENLL